MAIDAVFLFDAHEQRIVVLRHLLAGGDAPVGNAAIEVLPGQLLEFRLRALQRIDRRIRFDAAHHAVVGFFRNAALERARPKPRDPLRERLACALRAGCAWPCEKAGGGERALQNIATILIHAALYGHGPRGQTGGLSRSWFCV
jgi:hypothetical protein